MNKEYDFLFKIVIVGNSNVGKSSLLMRFADDKFKESYLATIGVDFVLNLYEILYLKRGSRQLKQKKKISNYKFFKKWDTAGQERFRTITNAYYKGADGIILVYDKANRQSYDDINGFWMNEVESYGEKNVSLMLLGNKSDLEERLIPAEEAQKYASDRNMIFYETSAKTAYSVESAFHEISKQLMLKREEKRKTRNSSKLAQPEPVALTPLQQTQQEKNSCNC